MSGQSHLIVESIKRRLQALTVVVVILCLLFGGGVVYTFLTLRQVQDAACSLRNDEESRIAQGREYLTEHPNGTRDIPKATLTVSIQNQEKTVDSLGGLPC